MAKTDNALAALQQLRKALSQGRDIAFSALDLMIKRVKAGDDLEPNPDYVRPARQPMKPMFTGQSTPEEPAAKPKAKAKSKAKSKSKPPRDDDEPPKDAA